MTNQKVNELKNTMRMIQ